MPHADILIIGGGIIGLATARQLQIARPTLNVIVLEKEPRVADHQTGRNSGVLHSGIYYKPGSLKAINCRLGKQAMIQFCRQHDIAHDICGKVIVALNDDQLPALHKIYQRGQDNGVECHMIDRNRLTELEPHAAGIQAIHVPETGIVDYRAVCNTLVRLIESKNGQVITSAKVDAISQRSCGITIEAASQEFTASIAVNCAGLHCDRIATLSGDTPAAKIVPFRGEYFQLKRQKSYLCRNLIYPVPDPSFPFLGVHFTRMIDGSVECGPNAVLAFARQGYRMRDVDIGDLLESLFYEGFRKLARKHWRTGAGEIWRSFSKRAFVKALQKLMPEITTDDLQWAPAGVRAQALLPNGQLVDDFLIEQTERMIHVINAPSPAATASLNIAKLIVEKAVDRL
jgi:L-2-hydroxyglutarate oxidase